MTRWCKPPSETDANDVDLHVYDDQGGHASFADKKLDSGGELYADVTFGMGKLQVIEHDGKGGRRFDERPFVVMRDGAYVDLGEYRGRR